MADRVPARGFPPPRRSRARCAWYSRTGSWVSCATPKWWRKHVKVRRGMRFGSCLSYAGFDAVEIRAAQAGGRTARRDRDVVWIGPIEHGSIGVALGRVDLIDEAIAARV